MNNILGTIFGNSSELSSLQMMARGIVVFALTLIMLRISGRRSFGQHSPFDACITVLLGSILARAVVGASPFLPTMATGVALVVFHRALAMLSVRAPALEKLISGTPQLLVSQGKILAGAARRGLVSDADIMQGVREQALVDDLGAVEKVMLERNGTISVVK